MLSILNSGPSSSKPKNQGFTLIELLITIAIIAIIAISVVIIFNPQQHLAESRDATREVHLNAIETALYTYQIDQQGAPLPVPIPETPTEICATGTLTSEQVEDLDGPNDYCDGYINLSFLIPTYIPRIPTDPSLTSSQSFLINQALALDRGTGYEIFQDQHHRVRTNARFETKYFPFTLTSTPGGEVIDFLGGQEYLEGDEVPIEALADIGWEFSHWSGDTQYLQDPNSPSTILNMPGYEVGINAHFSVVGYSFTLKTSPANGGEITTDHTGDFHIDDEITFTAVPEEGWQFTDWTGDTDHITEGDTNNATITLTMPAADVTLTANFEKINYTLTLEANPNEGSTSITEDPPYQVGDVVTVNAHPQDGWQFTSWTGDTDHITTGTTGDEEITLTMPAEDVELTANFATGFIWRIDTTENPA